MGFFDLFSDDPKKDQRKRREAAADSEFADEEMADADVSMELREEVLDVDKNRVRTGEVHLQKDVVSHEQTVEVPVSHDEVVIERTPLNGKPSDEPIRGEGETVSIPVTADRVEVGKHTVVREEVSAHKREVQETERVGETLRSEVAHVETEGDAELTSALDEEE